MGPETANVCSTPVGQGAPDRYILQQNANLFIAESRKNPFEAGKIAESPA